eukprot:scaffold2822_cov100-Isochrysis_galbana.AAC.8
MVGTYHLLSSSHLSAALHLAPFAHVRLTGTARTLASFEPIRNSRSATLQQPRWRARAPSPAILALSSCACTLPPPPGPRTPCRSARPISAHAASISRRSRASSRASTSARSSATDAPHSAAPPPARGPPGRAAAAPTSRKRTTFRAPRRASTCDSRGGAELDAAERSTARAGPSTASGVKTPPGVKGRAGHEAAEEATGRGLSPPEAGSTHASPAPTPPAPAEIGRSRGLPPKPAASPRPAPAAASPCAACSATISSLRR